MVLPEEVLRLLRRRIHERERALEVIAEIMVGDILQIMKQAVIEPLSLIGITTALQENERFAQLSMRRLIRARLSQDHNTAERQHGGEEQSEFAFDEETHGIASTSRFDRRQLFWPRKLFVEVKADSQGG